MMPIYNITIYNETNTFWEVKLDETPQKAMNYVKERAREYIKDAEKELTGLNEHDTAWELLTRLIKLAQEEFQTGEQSEYSGDESLFCLSTSTRAYMRAHIRAK